MDLMWSISKGDSQQLGVLVIHLSPRVTLIPHRIYPRPVVYQHNRPYSSIPYQPKVSRPILQHPQSPHPSSQKVKKQVPGREWLFKGLRIQTGWMSMFLLPLSNHLICSDRAVRPSFPLLRTRHSASSGGYPLCSALAPATCKPGLCPDNTLSLSSGLSTCGQP